MKTTLQRKIFWLSSLFVGLSVCMLNHSHAAEPIHSNQFQSQKVTQIKHNLALAKQEISKEKQLDFLANLVREAEDVYARDRDNAYAELWYGLSLASYATAKGGLTSGIYNRVARQHLENSLVLDDCAENGLAYQALSDLYKTKDQEKSQEYLNKAGSQHSICVEAGS